MEKHFERIKFRLKSGFDTEPELSKRRRKTYWYWWNDHQNLLDCSKMFRARKSSRRHQVLSDGFRRLDFYITKSNLEEDFCLIYSMSKMLEIWVGSQWCFVISVDLLFVQVQTLWRRPGKLPDLALSWARANYKPDWIFLLILGSDMRIRKKTSREIWIPIFLLRLAPDRFPRPPEKLLHPQQLSVCLQK